MTAESVSSEYPNKPPVWLVDHLDQWRQRRVSGRAGHALIVTSEDVEEASLFCHLLAAQEFCAEASAWFCVWSMRKLPSFWSGCARGFLRGSPVRRESLHWH